MELTPPLGKRIRTLRLARALLTGKDYPRAKLVLDADFAVSYADLAEMELGVDHEISPETIVRLGDALLGTGNGHLLLQKEWANTPLTVPLPATDPRILDQLAAMSDDEEEDFYSDFEIISLSELEMWA